MRISTICRNVTLQQGKTCTNLRDQSDSTNELRDDLAAAVAVFSDSVEPFNHLLLNGSGDGALCDESGQQVDTEPDPRHFCSNGNDTIPVLDDTMETHRTALRVV